ncbi:hypothetical protein TWF718_010323 [Orbilia javanica]|uniref:Transcription elongation factor 1 homolog n=1 Tax=Orbilia javanica TaxID=47235 RepID=A0AAN8MXQ4_9PEZI
MTTTTTHAATHQHKNKHNTIQRATTHPPPSNISKRDLTSTQPSSIAHPSTMGKRRKAIKVKGEVKESQKPLPTVFNCLFCNHERSIIIKLDKKNSIGSLHCNICGQTYQTSINYLSGAVDVYADWVDAADEVKKEQRRAAKRGGGSSESRGVMERRRESDPGEDDEDDIDDDADD